MGNRTYPCSAFERSPVAATAAGKLPHRGNWKIISQKNAMPGTRSGADEHTAPSVEFPLDIDGRFGAARFEQLAPSRAQGRERGRSLPTEPMKHFIVDFSVWLKLWSDPVARPDTLFCKALRAKALLRANSVLGTGSPTRRGLLRRYSSGAACRRRSSGLPYQNAQARGRAAWTFTMSCNRCAKISVGL